jgi:hypothetical protein
MLEKLNLLGAVAAHVIFLSSICTFVARLLGRVQLGHQIGYALLLMAFPLIYLLVKAPALNRPALYYIQAGLMLAWIVLEFLLDYVFKVDFRQTRWIVISYVMLFFAGTGGMLGVAAHAGRGWTISAIVLFLVMAGLTFIQRKVTGM